MPPVQPEAQAPPAPRRDAIDARFGKVRELLQPDGVALLHAIGSMEPPGATNAWIRKYIFPGGYCPSLSEVMAAIERSRLWVTDVEILRLHYADTLKEWLRRFRANRDKAAALYGERFFRMWEFYLASCEMGFRNGTLMVFQIQMARRRDAVPLTRDYIADYEGRSSRRSCGGAAPVPEPDQIADRGRAGPCTHCDVWLLSMVLNPALYRGRAGPCTHCDSTPSKGAPLRAEGSKAGGMTCGGCAHGAPAGGR